MMVVFNILLHFIGMHEMDLFQATLITDNYLLLMANTDKITVTVYLALFYQLYLLGIISVSANNW